MRTVLLFAILALRVTSLESPIDGYGIVIPEWEVEVTPGGPLANLSGTIEDVHDQLIQLNPTWDEEYAPDLTTDVDGSGTNVARLSRRTDFSGSAYLCRGRWPECPASTIVDGIRYLQRVSGRPTNGPGPGNCARVSCSYKSAIWWCNDSADWKTLAGFESIADGAQFLLDHCAQYKWNGWGYATLVAGQVFHRTNWNVIVRRDEDKC